MPLPKLIIPGTLKQQFMTYTVLVDVYSYSLEGVTKMKQLDPFRYELIYPATLICYLLLLKFAENK